MTLTELTRILTDYPWWGLTASGIEFTAYRNGQHQYHTVPFDVLNAVQPGLCTAAQHMLTRIYRGKKPNSLGSALLQCQLAYLQNPCLVPALNREPVYLAEVDVLQWNASNDYAQVHGVVYTLQKSLCIDRGRSRRVSPFVRSVSYVELDVPLPWMDTQYPGWRERYRAAEALGCTSSELTQAVCSPAMLPATTVVSLPDTLLCATTQDVR